MNDDQNTSQNPKLNDEPSTPEPPEADQRPKGPMMTNGMRTIQPMSKTFTAEPVKTPPPSTLGDVALEKVHPIVTASALDNPTSQPEPSKSVYPDPPETLSQPLPTGTVHEEPSFRPVAKSSTAPDSIYPPAAQEETHYTSQDLRQSLGSPTVNDKKAKLITIIVMALGVLLLVSSVLSINSAMQVNVLSFSGGLSILAAVVQAILAIGILRRSELARSVFVFFAILSIVVTLIANIAPLTMIYNMHKQEKATSSNTQQWTSKVENDSRISTGMKEQLNIELQEMSAFRKQILSLSGFIAWQIVASVVLNIAPLVFLTRPRVKAIFR